MCFPRLEPALKAWPVTDFDDAELDDLLSWLQEPEEASGAAEAAPTGHKPLEPPTPDKAACSPPMTVKLGSRPTAPSPFVGPEGQSFASRSATPAPSPRRSHARHTQNAALAQPLRSVSFRSLAPKSSTFTGAEQQRPLQPQPQALPQRAASCVAVPRLQSPAAAPLSASAVLPATCAPAAGAPTAAYHAPDSALAWAAGFSRLATQLGCAAPAPCGGLWDPPESSDLLVLLTMELSCCSRTGSPRAGASRSSAASAPSFEQGPSPGHKRKVDDEPGLQVASQGDANQRLRTSSHACGNSCI